MALYGRDLRDEIQYELKGIATALLFEKGKLEFSVASGTASDRDALNSVLELVNDFNRFVMDVSAHVAAIAHNDLLAEAANEAGKELGLKGLLKPVELPTANDWARADYPFLTSYEAVFLREKQELQATGYTDLPVSDYSKRRIMERANDRLNELTRQLEPFNKGSYMIHGGVRIFALFGSNLIPDSYKEADGTMVDFAPVAAEHPAFKAHDEDIEAEYKEGLKADGNMEQTGEGHNE